MVRAYKLGSVVVGLAASGLAWGQSSMLPPPPAAEPAGKVITINEAGKPKQKCRIVKEWFEPHGGKACQVQVLETGEMMTIVQTGPAMTDIGPGSHAKTMAMRIFHWGSDNTPPTGTPMPPVTVETTHVAPMPPRIETAQTTIVRTGNSSGVTTTTGPMTAGPTVLTAQTAPMPAGPTVQSATSPVMVHSGTAPMPTIVTGSATIQMPPGGDHMPRPMTPGGVVLTPGGSIHEFADGGGCCADSCTTCKPSILDRIKACFHKETCTTACPDACSTCTPANTVPMMHTAKGETLVPAPMPSAQQMHTATPITPATPVPSTIPTTTAPSEEKHTSSGLFHRHKPMPIEPVNVEMPKTVTQKADPLQDPAAYSNLPDNTGAKPATTAELAISTPTGPNTGDGSMPQTAAPVGMNGKVPLGAGSVMQAGSPQYVPVPVVTMPDVTRPSMPPTANIPNAPQPNQRLMSNGYAPRGQVPPPAMPVREMTGNAFGPAPAAAAEMQASAFNQGYPNGMGYAPSGYSGMQRYGAAPTPLQAAAQPGYYNVPPAQQVMPAGYPQRPGMMMPPAPPAPIGPQSWNGTPDPRQLLGVLHDALLPSQREWAADKLSAIDWKANAVVVQALVQAAKEDPAGSVRAGCIHSLVKMNCADTSVIAVCNTLKADTDPRVQHEAAEALAKLVPAQGPTTVDPAVMPASYVPPPRSN